MSEPAVESTAHRAPPIARANRLRRLGLSGNPFRILSGPETLDRLMDVTVFAEAEAYLNGGARVLEVLGHSGWGKSTWLSILRYVGEKRLNESWGYVYVRPETDRIYYPSPTPDCWCVDEAQRIRTAEIRRMIRHGERRGWRLILGTHRSFEPEFRSVGADYAIVRLSPPTADTIERFARMRIAAALRDDRTVFGLAPAALELLDRQTAGNLHFVDEILYEVFQDYVERGELPATVSACDVAAAIQRRASAY